MIRMISTLALVTALAGPAAAEQVKVSLIGKSDPAIRAEIHQAAKKVCREAYFGDRVAEFYNLDSCISDAEADAMAQVKAYQQATSSSSGSTASIAALSGATSIGR